MSFNSITQDIHEAIKLKQINRPLALHLISILNNAEKDVLKNKSKIAKAKLEIIKALITYNQGLLIKDAASDILIDDIEILKSVI